MGRSQLEKQKTHEKIVETASKRLREEGLEGIGVADLMKEAGLTVGGFYKHFASATIWSPRRSSPLSIHGDASWRPRG